MIAQQLHGDDKLYKILRRLTSRADRQDLLDNIAARGVSQTQQRFYDGAGPDGVPWVKSLRVRLHGGHTLRKSGRLSDSLTHEASADQAEWGTNLIYAGIHHFGGIIKAKVKKALAFKGAQGGLRVVKQVTMPARPFLGINDADRRDFGDVAQDWLEAMAK